MPFVYGKIYPEVESAGLLNHRFKVLIELREDQDLENFLPFIRELCTLKVYLNDIVDSPAHLELFVPQILNSGHLIICKELGLTPVILSKDVPDYNEKVKLMAEFVDADLVITEKKEILNFLNKEKERCFLVENRDGAKKNIEIFVKGMKSPGHFPLHVGTCHGRCSIYSETSLQDNPLKYMKLNLEKLD